MKHIEETIKLLNHIHENPEATQRELVDKLDVSLGKVNFIVNALVEKGIIKLKRFKTSKSKKGYLYIITPEGIKEKFNLTKRFLETKTTEYERLKSEIAKLKETLLTRSGDKNNFML